MSQEQLILAKARVDEARARVQSARDRYAEVMAEIRPQIEASRKKQLVLAEQRDFCLMMMLACIAVPPVITAIICIVHALWGAQ